MRALPVRGKVSFHALRVPAGRSAEQLEKKTKNGLANAPSGFAGHPPRGRFASDQAALQNCALLGN